MLVAIQSLFGDREADCAVFDNRSRGVGMKHVESQDQHSPAVPLCLWSSSAAATNSRTSTAIASPTLQELWSRIVARVEPTICSNGIGAADLLRTASINARISARCPLSCRQR